MNRHTTHISIKQSVARPAIRRRPQKNADGALFHHEPTPRPHTTRKKKTLPQHITHTAHRRRRVGAKIHFFYKNHGRHNKKRRYFPPFRLYVSIKSPRFPPQLCNFLNLPLGYFCRIFDSAFQVTGLWRNDLFCHQFRTTVRTFCCLDIYR